MSVLFEMLPYLSLILQALLLDVASTSELMNEMFSFFSKKIE